MNRTAKNLMLVVSALYLTWNFWARSQHPLWGFDFGLYYSAGTGDLSRWWYKNELAPLFWWCRMFDFRTAAFLWYGFQTAMLFHVLARLLNVENGWMLLPVALKVAGWSLGIGNIIPTLACLCLSPIGAVVAMVFKPYLAVFALGHAYREYRRTGASVLWAKPDVPVPRNHFVRIERGLRWR